MKITITKEFTDIGEALEFLNGQLPPAVPIRVDAEGNRVFDGPVAFTPPPPAAEQQTPPKRPRKPRADAGQPRGAYKPRAGADAASPTTPPPAPEKSTSSDTKSADSGAAVSPSVAPAKNPPIEPVQATPTPAAADLTLDDVRATLGVLNATKGKGTEACIAALKYFGVLRISELPKEKYAEFTKYVTDQLPKAAS